MLVEKFDVRRSGSKVSSPTARWRQGLLRNATEVAGYWWAFLVDRSNTDRSPGSINLDTSPSVVLAFGLTFAGLGPFADAVLDCCCRSGVLCL